MCCIWRICGCFDRSDYSPSGITTLLKISLASCFRVTSWVLVFLETNVNQFAGGDRDFRGISWGGHTSLR
jgi:hypothetical protein